MEPALRGLVDKTIDMFITPKAIARTKRLLEMFASYLKSPEAAVFGYVIGAVTYHTYTLILAVYGRPVTDAQMDELDGVLANRAAEIKLKIAKEPLERR